MFGKVEIEGKYIDYISNAPIANLTVDLYCNAAYQGKENPPIKIGSATTDESGNFKIKSKIATTNKYRLVCKFSGTWGSDTSFSLTKNKDINLGTIKSGENTVSYNIHLKSTTSNCLWFLDNTNNWFKLNAGSDTTIHYEKTLLFNNFKLYPIYFGYKTGICSDFQNIPESQKMFYLTSGTTNVDLNF
jgi:hypothetical protein